VHSQIHTRAPLDKCTVMASSVEESTGLCVGTPECIQWWLADSLTDLYALEIAGCTNCVVAMLAIGTLRVYRHKEKYLAVQVCIDSVNTTHTLLGQPSRPLERALAIFAGSLSQRSETSPPHPCTRTACGHPACQTPCSSDIFYLCVAKLLEGTDIDKPVMRTQLSSPDDMPMLDVDARHVDECRSSFKRIYTSLAKNSGDALATKTPLISRANNKTSERTKTIMSYAILFFAGMQLCLAFQVLAARFFV
jgi:hypothetical protein